MKANDLVRITYDIESYPNYLLISLKDLKGQFFEIDTLDTQEDFINKMDFLSSKLDEWVFIGFNNNHYDKYILELALRLYREVPKEELASICKEATSRIIDNKEPGFQILRKYGTTKTSTIQHDLKNHYGSDKMTISLKEAGVRIGYPILENLPFAPNKFLTTEEKEIVKAYCRNDVNITQALQLGVLKQKVRATFSLVTSFDLPLRFLACTDGECTEEILADKSLKLIVPETFRYTAPIDFKFKTPELINLVKTFEGITFNTVKMMNDEDEGFHQELTLFGGLKVSVALGGTHACHSKSKFVNVIDFDAGSMYPNMIRLYGFHPNTMKIDLYSNLTFSRLKLKHSDNLDDVEFAYAIKAVINTVSGYMNFPGGAKKKGKTIKDVKNRLYAPHMSRSMCITGQLLLLKLGEMLYEHGYNIVYLNTDGISFEDSGDGTYEQIVKEFDEMTGLNMEGDILKVCTFRDVNNFIIEKEHNGKKEYKLKGAFNCEEGKRNYSFARISVEAVIKYVTEDKPIAETIEECTDFNKFLLYQKYGHTSYHEVGLYDKNDNLVEGTGNVVRYYLSNTSNFYLRAKTIKENSLKSAFLTDNVKLVWNTNDFNGLPSDLDKEVYLNYAYKMLEGLTGHVDVVNEKVEKYIEELENILG